MSLIWLKLNAVKQFNSRKYIKDPNLIDYLLNFYVNMADIYFEINHKNGLIYILAHVEVNNVI